MENYEYRRAYIAAPIFTSHQLAVVSAIKALVALHHIEYFSPYDHSQRIWRGRAPKDCAAWERESVLKANVDNLHWADLLVAWTGGNGRATDTGVAWEMGYFNHCGGIVGVTLAYIHPSDQRQSLNLMLAGTVDAAAYGQAQLSQALVSLRNGELDKVREEFHPDKLIKHEREPIV